MKINPVRRLLTEKRNGEIRLQPWQTPGAAGTIRRLRHAVAAAKAWRFFCFSGHSAAESDVT